MAQLLWRKCDPALSTMGDEVITQKEEDIQKMLVCKTHIGTRNVDKQMRTSPFVELNPLHGLPNSD